MLVTEQDAITTKWRRTIHIRREMSAFAFNDAHPGRNGPFKNRSGRRFFPSRIDADIAKRFRFCPIYVCSRPKKHPDFTALSTVRIRVGVRHA
jgi:hypothetical protein